MTDRLQELIDTGYIKRRFHPNGKLVIYNYTPKTQYENLWEKDTIESRGLIRDLDGKVIARPFKKFFNYDPVKHGNVAEDYITYEKLDGSLGILYFYDNIPHIATRGSFDSSQALHATKLLHTKYKHLIPNLDQNLTYLFEIIYPENRIVVDYGKKDELILISIVETKTGNDLPLEHNTDHPLHCGFTIVNSYGQKDIKTLCELNNKNEEGYVIRLNSGVRFKIKFKDYVTLHGLVNMLTNIKIWEMLRDESYILD